MITGKQRAYLRGLANKLEATVYIGKFGLTENTLKEMDNSLLNHEMVKVKIQESADLDSKETANECAEILKAEFVQAIGRKFTLYRQAVDPEKKQIRLPK